MKSATLLSGEKNEPPESKPRQSENAKKIARLLKKRRELLEKEKLKIESDEVNIKIKNGEKEAKDLNQRSEPTSEEYDDEEPETITENSDSYDSDEFRVDVLSKDRDKGFDVVSFHKTLHEKHACDINHLEKNFHISRACFPCHKARCRFYFTTRNIILVVIRHRVVLIIIQKLFANFLPAINIFGTFF